MIQHNKDRFLKTLLSIVKQLSRGKSIIIIQVLMHKKANFILEYEKSLNS